ncbi:unnamed protein product [Arctia plantaginis]|uniref:Uncharacterized protein n=1 Tax=Arctia plantaginis TaxID=874455 RepID=A0A8S0Z6Y0_ARCPL|nr:unnamed protein product [Arctia plantaginis]
MESVDTASPDSPVRESEPTDWLADFQYYDEDPFGSTSSVFPMREVKPAKPHKESDIDDDGESVATSAPNSPGGETKPAEQEESEYEDDESVVTSAPNSPIAESIPPQQEEYDYDDDVSNHSPARNAPLTILRPVENPEDSDYYDDDTTDSALPASPRREARLAEQQAQADQENKDADSANQPSTSGRSHPTAPADPERLRLYGAAIYSAIIGSPERLSEYQEIQFEVTDRERRQRIEDIVDENNPCRCPTDTFDLCSQGNPYMESIVEKLRKMPKCLQYRAYRDILVYFKYLRRKHRKMLLRNAPINIAAC